MGAGSGSGAARSRATATDAFELEFTGGLRERVDVIEREPPTRLAIRYVGSESVFELERRDDGGCLLQVTCRCDDPAEWQEFNPGWVS